MSRRALVQAASLSTLFGAAGGESVAGPFQKSDFSRYVPEDKKFSPAWIRSLTERGEPAIYRREELRLIGMPVGGICAGQVYLGGDGQLWHWDIFNQHIATFDGHYANPPVPQSPLRQGFALRMKSPSGTQTRTLNAAGFGSIAFRGEYPIGTVDYADPQCPVTVRLEAFSPFIPLNTADSSLPAIVMQFTLHNPSRHSVECDLVGWLENAVCLHSGLPVATTRVERPTRSRLLVIHGGEEDPEPPAPARPDILFEDFEKETYEGWTVSGEAFGTGPIERERIPSYQGDVGGMGRRVVNSHASAPGEGVAEKDSQTGSLLSRPFRLERHFIHLYVGGGAHAGRTCVDLLVDGAVVRSVTGANSNQMQRRSMDVRPWEGREARIRIVDNAREGWGNIGVDHIVFSDGSLQPEEPLAQRSDFGSMVIGVQGTGTRLRGGVAPEGALPEAAFGALSAEGRARWSRPLAVAGSAFTLAPGKRQTVTFVLGWHFPNLALPRLPRGRHYATRFASARDAAEYVASNLTRLARDTRKWRDTWYQSTLPYWFLDRTFLNASTLATSTCHRFANGRFYGWEGVGCCEGTCAHVWHYAHAVARLFPELERTVREMADFGVGFEEETGQINFRGEHYRHWAADGQAGCILRAYREHQMSPSPDFLRRLWPRVKKALQFLMSRDVDSDGILDGPQHNTLDADWYGQIAWLSGLYLAALRAGEEMAREMGDEAFARECRRRFEAGKPHLEERLFNGEYFYHIGDPDHRNTIGSYEGCEIDQVLGQSWAWQVGLGRVLDEAKVKSALQALWRYNVTPDVGPFRAAYRPGRWYAMPGEGGTLMCSWPRGEASRVREGFDAYFNECMNGFEYQLGGHMIAEGMVTEGLAITRLVHDRYHPARRNPWNEVECGDHYARSMASYGVYLAACGYTYHGPRGILGFAPRIRPEHFEAAFTAAEGWGSYSQRITQAEQRCRLRLRHGRLALRTFKCAGLASLPARTRAQVTVNGKPVTAGFTANGDGYTLTFASQIELRSGDELLVVLT